MDDHAIMLFTQHLIKLIVAVVCMCYIQEGNARYDISAISRPEQATL
jgi:hypothetical protein